MTTNGLPAGTSSTALIDSLRTHPEGYSLPGPWYTSSRAFELDMDLIFAREWVAVACEAEIPEAGDYVVVSLGKSSVLLVRNDTGDVRAFHNVCRHRGAIICTGSKGCVGNLVCPYHQWTYNLDGRLIYTRNMGDDFPRENYGLIPVHVISVGGVIHICLAAEPPQWIHGMKEQADAYTRAHHPELTRVARVEETVEHGNWKLVMENNRECYHCHSGHPELTLSLFPYGFGWAGNEDAAFSEVHRRALETWDRLGMPHAVVDTMRTEGYRLTRMPLIDNFATFTEDGQLACRKLLNPDFPPAGVGTLSFWTAPNGWNHYLVDHIISFCLIPTGPDSSLLRTIWLVHRDAREGVDYDPDTLTRVWRSTNDQDRRFVELGHQGISGSGYVPGPYCQNEEQEVNNFVTWYRRRLCAALPAAA